MSNSAATVIIAGCDSGAPNHLFPTGSTFSDLIGQCAADASNHGAFVSCVAALAKDWRKSGLITPAQSTAILNCASEAAIP
jgi:hypothetical protein